MEDTVVIFGAGQIGRGFLGDIASESGYRVIFVDANPLLVEQINAFRAYPLLVAGSTLRTKRIGPVRALHIGDVDAIASEMTAAGCTFTAVGAGSLLSLAPVLAAGLQRILSCPGRTYHVVVCENLSRGAQILADAVWRLMPQHSGAEKERIGFVRTVVSRMVVAPPPARMSRDPLAVLAEPYNILPLDGRCVRGTLPRIRAFRPVDPFPPYEDLKLFLHNLPHAAAAYLGFLRGHRLIREALADRPVRRVVEAVLAEMSEVVVRRHAIPASAAEAYRRDIIERFSNPLLDDTVTRVAREVLRKLGPGERISGAISAALATGIFPEHVCVVAAAALCYNHPDDPQSVRLQEMLAADGIHRVLESVCGIQNGRVQSTIGRWYDRFIHEGRTPGGG